MPGCRRISKGSQEGPARLRLFFGAALLALLLPLTTCGGDPPQIVDYSPQRNALDVSTAAPVRITFDHDVDQVSVEARLRLAPQTDGLVRWINGHQLVYEHPTLRTATSYEVILEPGYRDPAGNVYALRHRWSFTTEGPPTLAGSSPANGDGDVDPSAYLSLDFSRPMDPSTLKSAISFTPNVRFDVRLDPTDSRRAIIAPSQLMVAKSDYQLLLNTAALDVDGNPLDRNQLVTFKTGAPRPLSHWIAFATDRTDGTPAGLWIVNERGFPRELFDAGAVQSFSWSPRGDSLLIEAPDQAWWEFTPGAAAARLPFRATWAASLAGGLGYVYIDDSGALHRLDANGNSVTVASGVQEAAVAPNGLRVAFINRATDTNEVWGYDVGLRTRYLLVTDSAPVSDVAWAPAGNRIAYLRHDLTTVSLRMRGLTGAAAFTTLTTGTDIGSPMWLPDSTHLLFSAAVTTPSVVVHKAFIINVVSPPAVLGRTRARTVLERTWRQAFYDGTATSDIDQTSQQKAFVRAVNSLLLAEVIGKYGEHIWLA